MKDLFRSGLFAFAVILAISVFTPSCTTTQNGSAPTVEAIKFYSFADTWAIAHAAYQGYAEQVVLGKVKPEDEREIDKAWNAFRVSFKLAFVGASKDWSAATPDDIVKLKDDLITIIRAAL